MIFLYSIETILVLKLMNLSFFNEGFWQMLLSGLIYGFAVAFFFYTLVQRKIDSSKLIVDKDKVKYLVNSELRNCYELLKKESGDKILITINLLYYWNHIDQKIIFDVFDKEEIKEYFDMYNYLDNIRIVCLKLEEMHYGQSSIPKNMDDFISKHSNLLDANKKGFIDCYDRKFRQ